MSNLLTKTKYVSLVIRKTSYPNDFISNLRNYIDSNCNTYAYICHNNDINAYGELEHLHYHFVLEYKIPRRLSTFLNEIVDTLGFINANGIEIARTSSRIASIQYLLHKNNPEKTQHKIDEVITNIPIDELKTIIDSETDDIATFDRILALIRERPNKMYLIKNLGINTYRLYRSVIIDMLDEYERDPTCSWL